ncbi:MAG TPA: SGNH/GDSL hydrolase family protein [Candidatus Saccharimonadia bacterium]|nr:SGNH/GDSL hydrolase family protein [Candidatus Saccharimonadia bacterium]
MNPNPAATTILCYGDSNTWGQKPDKTGRYVADVRWTGLLQQALGASYYIIEEGLSSRTTDLDYSRKPGRNGRTYLEPCLDSHMPLDLVILMLGTNDFKIEFHRSAAEIARAIGGLVELIQAKTAGNDGDSPAQVLLVSPILLDDTASDFSKFYTDTYNHDSALKSQQLAAALEPVARAANCAFIDAAQIAQAGDDGIHFSIEAHAALAEALGVKIKDMK